MRDGPGLRPGPCRLSSLAQISAEAENPLARSPTKTPAPATQAPPISFDDTRVAFASKSDAQLRKVYALFAAMNNGSLVKAGSGLMKKALSWGIPGTKFLIKHSIFEQFCGGETLADLRNKTETAAVSRLRSDLIRETAASVLWSTAGRPKESQTASYHTF